MENKWKDSDAKAAIEKYKDVSEDIAMRGLHVKIDRCRSISGASWRRQHLGQIARL